MKDLGNASPRFMRSTFYQVPLTKDLRRTCEMPFAVICQPLAPSDLASRVPRSHLLSLYCRALLVWLYATTGTRYREKVLEYKTGFNINNPS